MKPAVWVSSRRRVTGCFAGRSIGAPSAGEALQHLRLRQLRQHAPSGASSASRSASTSCIAATEVIALVIEAIQNTVSSVIGASASRSRRPKAPSYSVPRRVGGERHHARHRAAVDRAAQDGVDVRHQDSASSR